MTVIVLNFGGNWCYHQTHLKKHGNIMLKVYVTLKGKTLILLSMGKALLYVACD